MYQLYRDFNLVKKGPKNSGMGKPPPPFRAMPERKRAFPYEVFPYTSWSPYWLLIITDVIKGSSYDYITVCRSFQCLTDLIQPLKHLHISTALSIPPGDLSSKRGAEGLPPSVIWFYAQSNALHCNAAGVMLISIYRRGVHIGGT